MDRATWVSVFAAAVSIALVIGAWTFVMGTASKATVPGQASHETQRPQSPSAPTLPALW